MSNIYRSTAFFAGVFLCASLAQAATPTKPDAAAAAASQAQPGGQVSAQFDIYDLNMDGQLDSTEFASWVGKLRASKPQGESAEASKAWSDSLFAQADSDKNNGISKTEMTTLLSRGRQG